MLASCLPFLGFGAVGKTKPSTLRNMCVGMGITSHKQAFTHTLNASNHHTHSTGGAAAGHVLQNQGTRVKGGGTRGRPIEDMSGVSWAAAAGRKAGGGNVAGKLVGRGAPQMQHIEKQGGKKAKDAKPVDPIVAEQAALRLVAKESLEHAMETRDLELLSTAIQTYKDAAEGTDALWRANTMRKELISQARVARKAVAAVSDSAPTTKQPTEADAVAALEQAMEARDLAGLKAAVALHAEIAEDTDALHEARMLIMRLAEERKADKKKRLKEGGTKEKVAPKPEATVGAAAAVPPHASDVTQNKTQDEAGPHPRTNAPAADTAAATATATAAVTSAAAKEEMDRAIAAAYAAGRADAARDQAAAGSTAALTGTAPPPPGLPPPPGVATRPAGAARGEAELSSRLPPGLPTAMPPGLIGAAADDGTGGGGSKLGKVDAWRRTGSGEGDGEVHPSSVTVARGGKGGGRGGRTQGRRGATGRAQGAQQGQQGQQGGGRGYRAEPDQSLGKGGKSAASQRDWGAVRAPRQEGGATHEAN
jgi:hypothetical protein